MTNSSWPEIQRLFDEALSLPASERPSFVEREASSPEVAKETLELLESHEAPGKMGPMEHASSAPDAPIELPSQIGPYKILRQLGAGGMGTVYLAQRSDEQFEHQVALKVMREGTDIPSIRERFLAERQILAQLVHPNIAWLLDGSVTDDGRPYFVMEYVEGQPLLEYCDSRRLGVRSRLALFLDVCEAVSYAHQNLVVHRDLKPGNVFVTDDGHVKLMDFGIAKLLDDEHAGPKGSPITRTGPAPMTPEYAAPEQLKGEPITTATDVYQLGGLLYQLLTGRRPFDGTDFAGPIAAAVLTEEPSKPSTAVGAATVRGATASEIAQVRGSTVRRLTKQLNGDLDQVVLKALRREPDQRFGSVEGLAEDVRRYLAGRPVRARRGTLTYRASRFIRRNRFAASAAAAALAAMVAGVVGTVSQASRAQAEALAADQSRLRAEREAEHAREVTDFMVGLFDVASDQAVRADTLRLLPVLERGVAALEDSVDLEAPSRRRLLDAVSRLYGQMGRMDEAERLADESLALARTVGEEDPLALPEALLRRGAIDYQHRNLAGSDTLTAEALALYEGLLAQDPSDSVMALEVAETRVSLATVLWRLQRLDEADSLIAVSADWLRGIGDEQALARALDVRGAVLFDRGLDEDALEVRQEVLAIRRRLLPPGHMLISVSMNNVASTMLNTDRLDEAQPLMHEVLEHRRAQFGDEHPMVAAAIHNLGALYAELDEFDESIEYYEQALAMRRKILGEDNGEVAMTLSAYALMLQDDMKRCDLALPLYREAKPMWERAMGPTHGFVFKTQANIGTCLAQAGSFEVAERELLAAHGGLLETVGPTNGETVRARRYLHSLYEAWGRPGQAAEYEPVEQS